ncbi:MAG: translocation/assembly module TamB domain-containing protein [Phocaeicola sp.]
MVVIRLFKYTFRVLVGALLGLYITLLLLVDLPWVQQKLSTVASKELSKLLNTEVSIGSVQLGLLNRIVLEDVVLEDQTNQQMIEINRLAAKFEFSPLLKQRIVVNSLQLYDFSIHLRKESLGATPNYQFLMDALAAKDSTKASTPIDLRLNTVLIRRGELSYDVASVPATPNQFNPNHLAISNLFATLSIKALQNDSINASIRRLSFNEQSGFSLGKLSTKLIANQQQLQVSRLSVDLPRTSLNIDSLTASYDSLPNLFQLNPTTKYQVAINGEVVLADIAPFIPALEQFHSPIQVELQASGEGKNVSCPLFSIHTPEGVALKAEGEILEWSNLEETQLHGEIKELSLSSQGVESLFANLKMPLPPVIKQLGDMKFRGETTGRVSDLSFIGSLQTEAGGLEGSMRVNQKREGARSYSGQIHSERLHIGKILNQENSFGSTAFHIDLKGFNYEGNHPESYLKGVVSSFEYNQYTYENISIDGLLKEGGFSGNIAIEDPNGSISIEGAFQTAKKTPDFKLVMQVKNVKLDKLNLSPKHEDMELSATLFADFSGASIDNMDGSITLDSLLLLKKNEPYYFLDKFTLTAGEVEGRKELKIDSDFLTGSIEGNYSYATLPQSILRTVDNYLPSLVKKKKSSKKHIPNEFEFKLELSNAAILSKLFHIPLELHFPIHLTGYFHDADEELQIKGYFPEFTYNKTRYDSGMLLFDNDSTHLKGTIRTGIMLKSGAMLNVSADASANGNQLTTTVNWWNNTEDTYGGKLVTQTSFIKEPQEGGTLKTQIEILPTKIALNDTIWNIHNSQIEIDSGRVSINNFWVENQKQFLRVNGKITQDPSDSCVVDLQRINVGYILDLVQFKDVAFDGLATGKALLKNTPGGPDMRASLYVEGFTMNKSLLGNADIKAKWDHENGDIVLQADMQEEELSRTKVRGFISPKRKELDLNITADRTHLGLLAPFVEGIVSEINGRVSGKIRLFGDLAFLDLEGGVKANLDTKIDVLNTYFQVREDSVHLKSGQILFSNITLYDRQGHSGLVSGGLYHNKLKNLRYLFEVEPNNMLLYHTTRPDDLPFFGKVYGTGKVKVSGGEGQMNVDATLRTNSNTEFTYDAAIMTEATSNQFITFVDKTPQRMQDQIETDFYHPLNVKNKKASGNESPLDLRINLMLEATPDATIRVIVDSQSGDNITTTGSGNLQVNFYDKGDFRMFGNYTIDKGVYKLSMQEIIRKDFILNPGGTVRFTGDPYDANLNLQASYTVNSASIRDLGMGIQTTQGGQSSIQVNCLMNLTGNLANPIIKFDLELPTVNSEDRQLIRSVTQTEEQLNTQIIYLLTIGKFYAYDYANGGQSSNATSSLAFNTLSGQLNNMLAQVIDNKNWDIGANLTTGEKGWTDVEAQAMLSGRLLNNRLLFNGQFGYRENSLTNSNFIGDFEAIYLLEKKGEWRLKGYSKTNERFYMKSTLTTQGIGLMYKKDFDAWNELFNWFPWRRKENKTEFIIQ